VGACQVTLTVTSAPDSDTLRLPCGRPDKVVLVST